MSNFSQFFYLKSYCRRFLKLSKIYLEVLNQSKNFLFSTKAHCSARLKFSLRKVSGVNTQAKRKTMKKFSRSLLEHS